MDLDIPKFQFLTGAISSSCFHNFRFKGCSFQFLTGAISRTNRLSAFDKKYSFNSLQVRLVVNNINLTQNPLMVSIPYRCD